MAPSGRQGRGTDLSRFLGAGLRTGFGILLVGLAAMWIVELVDWLVLDDRLQGGGIHPRQTDGLDGILWAPFLHADLGHIVSNSLPLVVLGGLVSARGLRYWVRATVAILLVGGLATWVFASSGNHIGASGLVFGYFGVLVGAAWFERRPAALAGALLAIFLYSSIVVGLVPQPGLSWEGHLAGMVVGLGAARLLAEPRRRVGDTRNDDVQPWEVDEPWLEEP